jgi:hypothetical protein
LTVILFDFGHYLVNRHARAAGEREFRIAPTAPEVAASRPHKNARQSGVARLALYALVNLSDSHIIRFVQTILSRFHIPRELDAVK